MVAFAQRHRLLVIFDCWLRDERKCQMKVLVGCDVDPILPLDLHRAPEGDIWRCLDDVELLIGATKGWLPPMTWLIRSDESVRFSTGDFASGYTTRRALWQGLVLQGHELGWHMHLMSFDPDAGRFRFDPRAGWLSDAWRALSTCFRVRSTRVGWDYADEGLLRVLERLGIEVDFSALPGMLAWHSVGGDRIVVDWRRCPATPYHPSENDYQRPGNMNLLEIPITQFRCSAAELVRRIGRRLQLRSLTFAGVQNKTRMMSDRWITDYRSNDLILAFYFHPEDLTGAGVGNFCRNLERLCDLPDVEFVTASGARRSLLLPMHSESKTL
jgi:hypothetical protein